jgi:hypothetical protein
MTLEAGTEVLSLLWFASPPGDEVAPIVEGDEAVEDQPVGALGIGEEQHLSRLQVLREHRSRQHHVAGREPWLHRAGDDHMALEADESRREGEEHQAGHGHQQGRHDHPVHIRRPEGPAHAGPGGATQRGRGHGVFCASHVKVALDCLFCAALSSLTA